MINFICWKWETPGYRTRFTAEHVNVLASMISRHYPAPHRMICCTNDATGINPAVEIVADREDFSDTPSPHGVGNPSCYRRLRIFEPNAAATFGERIVSIDLDCVVTGDLRPLFDRREDFVGWSDVCWPKQHCGSLTLLLAGSRRHVWTSFDPEMSPRAAMVAGCLGSDQGHVSHCLPSEAQWTQADGVYNWRFDLKGGALPGDARVVFFTGGVKPWQALRVPWIRENWR